MSAMAATLDSCDATCREAQSSVGPGEGVVSGAAPGAEWLSELIGQTAANRFNPC